MKRNWTPEETAAAADRLRRCHAGEDVAVVYDDAIRSGAGEAGVLIDRATLAEAYLAAPDLLAELRETADWLDGRVTMLRLLASDDGRVRAAAVRHQLRDEAARFEGRAAVIRQTIFNATRG